jgi:hypothetical protein
VIVELPVQEVSSKLFERISAPVGAAPVTRVGRQFKDAFPRIYERLSVGRVKFMSLDELRRYAQEFEAGPGEKLTIPLLDLEVRTSNFALWGSAFIVGLFFYVAVIVKQFASSGLAPRSSDKRVVEMHWVGFARAPDVQAVFLMSLLLPISVPAISVSEQLGASGLRFSISVFLLLFSIFCAVATQRSAAIVRPLLSR